MSVAAASDFRVKPTRFGSERFATVAGLVLFAVSLLVFLTLPLAMLFERALVGKAGEFVGLFGR